MEIDNTHFIEYELNSFKEEIATSNLEISSYEIKYGELFAVCRGLTKLIDSQESLVLFFTKGVF